MLKQRPHLKSNFSFSELVYHFSLRTIIVFGAHNEYVLVEECPSMQEGGAHARVHKQKAGSRFLFASQFHGNLITSAWRPQNINFFLVFILVSKLRQS